MTWLRDRIAAVLAGSAIGDALGGPTEGFSPEQIQQRYGGRITGIVPPFYDDWETHRPFSPWHKGDGHITDDTLMTQALIEVYAKRRDHLDAFAMAADLVPLLLTDWTWIPEMGREAVRLQRIFLAEKWMVTRLQYGHVDPREAGVGNIVNCGAAMYMAPTGVVNAGNPRRAYDEAIDMAGAHQSSYGREAAGVFAAAVAASLTVGATVDDVVDVAVELAHDGTRAALEAVAKAARNVPEGASDDHIGTALRDAIRPFDTVGEQYRQPAMDARLPSRTKSIEELPVALGMLLAYRADFRATILGSINYGRDCDSIASMAGSIAGGLGGREVVATDWLDAVVTASKLDFDKWVTMLTDVTEDIRARDIDRVRAELRALEQVAQVGAAR